jgi:hypothetical protein
MLIKFKSCYSPSLLTRALRLFRTVDINFLSTDACLNFEIASHSLAN